MSNGLELQRVVEDYLTSYNSFNIDKMLEYFTEDCRFELIRAGEDKITCQGKAKLKEWITQSAFVEKRQTVTKWIIAKDFVVVEIDYTPRLASEEEPVLKGISIYEIELGKIKRLVNFS